MTAIADQTHDELATTIGIASGSRTKGVPTPLTDALIHLRTHADETKGAASRGAIGKASLTHLRSHADETKGAASRGAIGKASRRVSKIATRGVTNLDTIGHCIGTLCWRLRTARSGERIANPRAATPATVAGHPESRSN